MRSIAVAVLHARPLAAFGLLATTVLLSSAGPAFACPSCFGEAQGPLVDAARLGIWLLLVVTFCLQGAFAVFFLYLRRRASSCADPAQQRSVPSGASGT